MVSLEAESSKEIVLVWLTIGFDKHGFPGRNYIPQILIFPELSLVQFWSAGQNVIWSNNHFKVVGYL